MKFSDLHFQATDCCAEHVKAQVTTPGGEVITVTRCDKDVYNVTVTNEAGLVSRSFGLSPEQVAALPALSAA